MTSTVQLKRKRRPKNGRPREMTNARARRCIQQFFSLIISFLATRIVYFELRLGNRRAVTSPLTDHFPTVLVTIVVVSAIHIFYPQKIIQFYLTVSYILYHNDSDIMIFNNIRRFRKFKFGTFTVKSIDFMIFVVFLYRFFLNEITTLNVFINTFFQYSYSNFFSSKVLKYVF